MIMNGLHCRRWWKLCRLGRFLVLTATVPKEQGSSQNDNSYTCSNSCVETRVTAASLVRGTAVAVVASRTRASRAASGDGVVSPGRGGEPGEARERESCSRITYY